MKPASRRHGKRVSKSRQSNNSPELLSIVTGRLLARVLGPQFPGGLFDFPAKLLELPAERAVDYFPHASIAHH